MNLFLYALARATSRILGEPLSSVFFHDFMQVQVQPLLLIMLCLIAFFFPDTVFHRSLQHANKSKSSILIISFPLILTANFLTIALPTLLTNILLGSAIELDVECRFAVPGMIMSSSQKFRNLTNSN